MEDQGEQPDHASLVRQLRDAIAAGGRAGAGLDLRPPRPARRLHLCGGLQSLRDEVRELRGEMGARPALSPSSKALVDPVISITAMPAALDAAATDAAEAKAEQQVETKRREEEAKTVRRPLATEAIDAALVEIGTCGDAATPGVEPEALTAMCRRRLSFKEKILKTNQEIENAKSGGREEEGDAGDEGEDDDVVTPLPSSPSRMEEEEFTIDSLLKAKSPPTETSREKQTKPAVAPAGARRNSALGALGTPGPTVARGEAGGAARPSRRQSSSGCASALCAGALSKTRTFCGSGVSTSGPSRRPTMCGSSAERRCSTVPRARSSAESRASCIGLNVGSMHSLGGSGSKKKISMYQAQRGRVAHAEIWAPHHKHCATAPRTAPTLSAQAGAALSARSPRSGRACSSPLFCEVTGTPEHTHCFCAHLSTLQELTLHSSIDKLRRRKGSAAEGAISPALRWMSVRSERYAWTEPAAIVSPY
eukprot:7386221-Prymnesium_polylepis.1